MCSASAALLCGHAVVMKLYAEPVCLEHASIAVHPRHIVLKMHWQCMPLQSMDSFFVHFTAAQQACGMSLT